MEQSWGEYRMMQTQALDSRLGLDDVVSGTGWRWGDWRTVLVIANCVLLAVLWPGDIQWNGDQLLLVERALASTAAGRLATVGLMGTRGLPYGPLPTWIYQGLLALTHDPLKLVLIRSAAAMGATALALLWLGKGLRMSRLFIAAVLASPHLVYYSRMLWDNTFCIPLSALLLASYFHYLRTSSAWSFRVALASLLILPTIHLMSVPICGAVAVDMVLHPRDTLRWKWTCILALSVFAITLLPYFALVASLSQGISRPPMSLSAWLFPLLGGWTLSTWGLGVHYSEQWLDGHFGIAVTLWGIAGSMIVVAVWVGVARVAWQVWSGWHTASRRTWQMRAKTILLVSVACQVMVSGVMRAEGYPHYFNAVWAVYTVMAWEGATLMVAQAYQGAVQWAYCVLGVTVTLALALMIHRTGGTLLAYGPTLTEQLRMARALERVKKTGIVIDAPMVVRYPVTIPLLQYLDGANSATACFDHARVTMKEPSSVDGKLRVLCY